MKDKKRAVTALLYNEDGEILSVSRKTDHNDFGLPGGRVEEGETDEQALIREVKEETGLEISDLRSYFEREDGEYIATTYLANYTGTISSVENAVVKWTNFEEILRGSFGKYNQQLLFYTNTVPKLQPGDMYHNPATDEYLHIIDVHPKALKVFQLFYWM